MRTYQSVLPAATRKPCRDMNLARRITTCVAGVLNSGFWFCADCDGIADRLEGENGQPAHCARCGSHRLTWNPPLTTVVHPELLEPEDLRV